MRYLPIALKPAVSDVQVVEAKATLSGYSISSTATVQKRSYEANFDYSKGHASGIVTEKPGLLKRSERQIVSVTADFDSTLNDKGFHAAVKNSRFQVRLELNHQQFRTVTVVSAALEADRNYRRVGW